MRQQKSPGSRAPTLSLARAPTCPWRSVSCIGNATAASGVRANHATTLRRVPDWSAQCPSRDLHSGPDRHLADVGRAPAMRGSRASRRSARARSRRPTPRCALPAYRGSQPLNERRLAFEICGARVARNVSGSRRPAFANSQVYGADGLRRPAGQGRRAPRCWRGGGQTPSGGSPLPGANLGGFWIRRRAPVTARVPPRRVAVAQTRPVVRISQRPISLTL